MARRKTTAVELPHLEEMEVPAGKLYPGREFTVKGEGRFRFRYGWAPDGSVTCYGPITGAGKHRANVRSFTPKQVRTVHRKTTERR